MSSMTLVCSASVRGHQVTWPMTICRRGWRSGGGKRAAAVHDGVALLFEVGGRIEVETFQSGGRGGHGRAEFTQLDGDVGHHHVHQVDGRPSQRAPAAVAHRRCAHLLQDFAIEAAEEERVGDGAKLAPAGGVGVGTEVGGRALEVLGNLARHEKAVLVSALIGLSLDVEVDPAGGGIAVAGPKVPTASRAGHSLELEASSRLRPSNQALPWNAPPLATVSRIWSWARVATKRRVRRRHPSVPPRDSECTSKGMEAMASAAPAAIGERPRSRTTRASVRPIRSAHSACRW